ncbi:MAG TPA: ECF-type sigma factor [Gemmataceae bacterium]|jgi:hypothetical protein
MPSAESVTIWIQQLKEGERAAVQKLWEGYFPRLVRQAQGWLRCMPVKVVEAEDVERKLALIRTIWAKEIPS